MKPNQPPNKAKREKCCCQLGFVFYLFTITVSISYSPVDQDQVFLWYVLDCKLTESNKVEEDQMWIRSVVVVLYSGFCFTTHTTTVIFFLLLCLWCCFLRKFVVAVAIECMIIILWWKWWFLSLSCSIRLFSLFWQTKFSSSKIKMNKTGPSRYLLFGR